MPHPDAFRPVRPAFDVLVVAGDVWQGEVEHAMATVARLADDKPVVMVLGNHEFWNHQVDRQRRSARQAADRHQMSLLDDASLDLAGLRFVGGTLWGDGQLAGRHATPDLPTGERIVSCKGRDAHPITNADQADLHHVTQSVIETAAAVLDPRPLVVVTHHAPHPSCLPAAQRTGWVAGHSASDLSHLTDSGQIALWVHGHTHETTDQVRPGGTRIVSNAAGPGFTNPAFRDDWVVGV